MPAKSNHEYVCNVLNNKSFYSAGDIDRFVLLLPDQRLKGVTQRRCHLYCCRQHNSYNNAIENCIT